MQLRFSALNFRPLAALLILAALLLGSSVDAAACGSEFTAHAQVEAAADGSSQQGSGSKDKKHAVCAHGHCHHGSQIIGGTDASDGATTTPSIHFVAPQGGLTPTASSLPKPPPRA